MFRALDELKNWLFGLFVILLLTGGCNASEIRLDDTHNNSQQEIVRGQIIVVTLASNPTTGYRWEVAEADKAVLRQVGDAEFKSSAVIPHTRAHRAATARAKDGMRIGIFDC